MQRAIIKLALGLLLTAMLTLGVTEHASAGRPDCARVVSEIDRVTGRRGKQRADPGVIARKLGVEPAWVWRCADTYGRRLSRTRVGRDGDEQIESWESDEGGEPEPEDVGEDGRHLSNPEGKELLRQPVGPRAPGLEHETDQVH